MKEIERRVQLTEAQAKELTAKLRQQGAEFKSKKRLIVDLSDDLETRTSTVMVRVNDGKVEIVAKNGGVKDAVRTEADVQVSSSLENALHLMALLGYESASYGFRSMQICEIDGVEFSIRCAWDMNDIEVLIGINLEVELTREGTVEELDARLAEYGLKPMTDDEAVAMFKKFHDKANGDYTHSEEAAKKLQELTDNFMK